MTSRRQFLVHAGLLAGTSLGFMRTLQAAVDAGLGGGAGTGLPRTLSTAQDELVATLAELIIPTTETPGACAAGVSAFIDGMITRAFSDRQRYCFLRGLAEVDAHARSHGAAFMASTAERQSQVLQDMAAAARETRAGAAEPPFFDVLKDLTLVGYYTSEIGATQELRYLHVAGYYDGDVPLATIGRAYS